MAKLGTTNVFGDLTITGSLNGGNIVTSGDDISNTSSLSDSLTTRLNQMGTLSSLGTSAKGNLVAAINEVNTKANTASTDIGTLSSLKTSAKSNLVAAVNEVFQSGNNAKTLVVNALIARGVTGITTSSNWSTITSKISTLTYKQPISVSMDWYTSASNGYRFNKSGDYYISSNKGVDSSYSLSRFKITNPSNLDVYIDYVDEGEATFDCGYIIKPNTACADSNSHPSSSDCVYYGKDRSSSSKSGTVVLTSPGTSFTIYAKFVKDSSVNTGGDSLKIKIYNK